MKNIKSFIIESNPEIIRADLRNHLLKTTRDANVSVKVWEIQYKIIRNAYYKLNKKVL